jgi:hypothetical protein
MSHLTTEKLDATERQEWNRQLKVIEKNKDKFWEMIEAVGIIRKQRLFRQDFKTFEEFVESRVEGIGLRYTNKLIECAEARKKLGTIVPENVASEFTKPHQLNELTDVPDDKLEEVATKAVEYAGPGNAPTAKDIQCAKQTVMPETHAKPVVQKQDGNEWVDVEQAQSAQPSIPIAVQDITQADIDEEIARQSESTVHPKSKISAVDQSQFVASTEDQLRALLSRMDAVDALGIVLEAIGPTEDQAMVLAQSYANLVDALKGLS